MSVGVDNTIDVRILSLKNTLWSALRLTTHPNNTTVYRYPLFSKGFFLAFCLSYCLLLLAAIAPEFSNQKWLLVSKYYSLRFYR